MKKLLALALCSVSLIASPVLLAQGSNPSPRGASAGDADGPGASDANIGGVSGDEVANKISGGANSNESSGTKGAKVHTTIRLAAHVIPKRLAQRMQNQVRIRWLVFQSNSHTQT